MPAPALGQEVRAAALGGVRHPGTYAMPKGSRLSTLIESAGGFAVNAFPVNATLTRNSLITARKAELRGLISKAESEAAATPGEEGAKREFFASLTQIEPSGRTDFLLPHPRLLKGSVQDLLLEDGDTLVILTEKPPVTVAGAVGNKDRRSYPHSADAKFTDYIRLAGGFSKEADKNGVYLIRGDATVAPLSLGMVQWNPTQSRWEIAAFTGNAPRIEPGDTIVVPAKQHPGSWARNVKNLPALLMRISAMTGTIVGAP